MHMPVHHSAQDELQPTAANKPAAGFKVWSAKPKLMTVWQINCDKGMPCRLSRGQAEHPCMRDARLEVVIHSCACHWLLHTCREAHKRRLGSTLEAQRALTTPEQKVQSLAT
jgi:hypothetical protein